MSARDPIAWLSVPRRGSPLVVLALALTACPSAEPNPRGPEGPPGVQGETGPDGPTGSVGTSWLANATTLDRGSAECPYGGVRYDVGLDDGSNGGVKGDLVLQDGEIDQSDLVCYAPGTFDGFEAPEGPAGTATIDMSGGAGQAQGGNGGQLGIGLSGTGGHLTVWPSGHADTDFVVPSSDQAYVGSDSVVVGAGTTLKPRIIDPSALATLVEGDVFLLNDLGGFDEALYVRRSGNNVLVSGLRIEAGGTLIVPRDSGATGRAYLAVTEDIVNAGTITTEVLQSARTSLVLGARHYWGEPTSRVDLSGPAGTQSASGGYGGGFFLVTAEGSEDLIDGFASDGALASCPTGSPTGGIVNRGVVDLSSGALGASEIQGSRPGGNGLWCAGEDLYNTGAFLARGIGSGGEGGRFDAKATVGLFHGGAIDVHGGTSPYQTGNGGTVTLEAARVVVSGTVDASAPDIPSSSNCASTCTGGQGGSLVVLSYYGGIAVSGDLFLDGGDAIGHNGDEGYAGQGGDVALESQPGSVAVLGSIAPPGPIDISSDASVRGGAGSGIGGPGGSFSAQLFYDGSVGVASGQGISLLGYSQIRADGGDGFIAGSGGPMFIVSGEGFTENRESEPEAAGVVSLGSIGGSAVVYVPMSARGGTGTPFNHAEGVMAGGNGGFVQIIARMSVPTPNARAILGAPVDASGGSGTRGGRGGFTIADGAGYSEIVAPITNRGGSGSLTDAEAGYGAEGGVAAVRSQYDIAVSTSDIDISGGDGFYAGEGGRYFLYGPEVDGLSDVVADGGAGSMTAGSFGGEGGIVDVWSSDTWSVVTGTFSIDPGLADTPGPAGSIRIDGFILP